MQRKAITPIYLNPRLKIEQTVKREEIDLLVSLYERKIIDHVPTIHIDSRSASDLKDLILVAQKVEKRSTGPFTQITSITL